MCPTQVGGDFMALKDFIYVPKVNDFNIGGEMIIVYDNYNPYRVCYQSDNEYSIRAGVYSVRPGVKQFVFVSTEPITSGIDLILQSPYLTIVNSLSEITTPLPNNLLGYYGVMNFQKERLSASIKGQSDGVKWWEDINELYAVLSYGEAPSPSSGVVVTCVGTPLAPDNNGVIVYCIGQLLDPNQQGGTSEPGGGKGTFDDTSDPIPYPILPDISAADVGLITLFRPTKDELQALGRILWTNITDFIENLNKIFSNPMDYIISLNIFPCIPDVGESREIKIGSWTSDIDMKPVLSQWYTHNCGTIRINEYWGSALDYAPNTKISMFLPFIGSVSLNTDEVMGRTISLKYNIDLLSGQCVAMIAIDDSVWYQFTGECSVSIPLTASDWSRIYTAAMGAIGVGITGFISAAGAGAAAGGATAALAGSRASEAISMAGQNFAMLNETSKGIKGVQEMRGRMLEAAEIASNAAKQAASAPTRVGRAVRASRISNTINNTLSQVVSGKGYVQHSGTVSGSAGLLGVKVPYIIIEFPNQSLADNYRHFVGYPSNMSGKLSEFKGYTECEQVIPNGFTGTDDELAELLEVLKGGVYL